MLERAREGERAVAIMLQQVAAPSAAPPSARHRGRQRRRASELVETRQRFPRKARDADRTGVPSHHSAQNGSLNPGGIGMPAVRPPIFSWVVASTRRTASFIAAATRSSSMSLSSPEQ